MKSYKYDFILVNDIFEFVGMYLAFHLPVFSAVARHNNVWI